MEFEKRKAMAMAEMSSSEVDKSPKGTLDAPIIPLLDTLNQHPFYFTTSSCSGRISILSQPQNNPSSKNKKKKAAGGSWLFITHEPADPEVVVDVLFSPNSSSPSSFQPSTSHESLVLRFEPFILAVECKNVSAANTLVSSAISSGFRESGITSIHKRIMVAIRCSIRLEVPLGETNRLMVSPEYVQYLIGIANEKMAANKRRTDGFLQVLHCMGPPHPITVVDNHHNQHGLLASGFNPDAKELDSMSKKILLEKDGLIDTETQRSYPPVDICESGIYGDVLESAGKVTGEDKSLMEKMLYSNQSAIGDLNLERTNTGFGVSTSIGCSLSVVKMTVTGEPVEKLFLWGHSACVVNNRDQKEILIFGGFGGSGRHARRNDSLMLDPGSGILKVINAVGPPPSRMGHSLSAVGEHIFVIGGRADPTQIMNDVWVFYVNENQWKLVECSGSVFHPRHRQAAAVVGSKIYVFGGLNNDTIYSCMHVLDTQNLQWNGVSIQGEWPCARHSHSMVVHDSQLYLFGGYDGEKALGDLYSFDVGTCLWKELKTIGRTPSARFSHSMFVYNHCLGIFGGCPVKQQFEEVSLLDLRDCVWKHVTICSLSRDLFVRSTATVVDDDLIVVGGGASCYAFGTKFNEPVKINLFPSIFSADILSSIKDKSIVHCKDVVDNPEISSGTNGSVSVTNERKSLYNNDGKTAFDGAENLVLKLNKSKAKLGKDLLKKLGWLDPRRKVYSGGDGLHIFLPISKNCYPYLEGGVLDSVDALCTSDGIHSSESSGRRSVSINEASFSMALNLLLACGGSVLVDDVVSIRKVPKAPQKILREAICSLIKQKGLPLQLLEQLPTRWERLGDIVVLPVGSFKDKLWETIAEDLWPVVAGSLGAKRLARQGRIAPNGTRDSKLEILVGDSGWVSHHENGIIYSFDSTKCMFSSGNLSEKLRMGQRNCRDEIVVDLFAGIGYFVLPFLVMAKAKLVYACEWNPYAVEALRYNIRANSVCDRCIILEGDNRITAPKGVADRVCLGLLPTSECSWVTAVRALRTEGGILHVHGNVKDSEEGSWSEYVIKSIDSIAKSEGYCWDVSIEHLERVKWYGPHIRHVVVDVRCKLLKI